MINYKEFFHVFSVCFYFNTEFMYDKKKIVFFEVLITKLNIFQRICIQNFSLEIKQESLK
jgi:hypothetical protein